MTPGMRTKLRSSDLWFWVTAVALGAALSASGLSAAGWHFWLISLVVLLGLQLHGARKARA